MPADEEAEGGYPLPLPFAKQRRQLVGIGRGAAGIQGHTQTGSLGLLQQLRGLAAFDGFITFTMAAPLAQHRHLHTDKSAQAVGIIADAGIEVALLGLAEQGDQHLHRWNLATSP